MAFLGLYWGEGFKESNHLGMTNGDPTLIKFVLDYLRSMTESRITITIRYYPDNNIKDLKELWSDLTSQHVKMKPVTDKRSGKKKKLKYGIAVIQVNDWILRAKVNAWLQCWKREIGAVAQ